MLYLVFRKKQSLSFCTHLEWIFDFALCSVINWLQHFRVLKIQILGTEITFQSAIE